MAAGEAAVCMRSGRVMRCGLAGSIAAFAFAASLAHAAPLDLLDPRARAVLVRFENSPADAPERLAAKFTVDIPARFDWDAATGHATIRIAGRDVERDYFGRQPLRPGSFSDYVWTFDPRTGHVISASLSGTFIRRYALGPIGKQVDTHFEARLSTLESAGFSGARRIFGQVVFPFCGQRAEGCRLVPPASYDARTGYVNAVGSIRGTALGMSADSFAAIGEAIFSEQAGSATADYAGAR
jgi:hypothetical protein